MTTILCRLPGEDGDLRFAYWDQFVGDEIDANELRT